jgi:hypothetical protein
MPRRRRKQVPLGTLGRQGRAHAEKAAALLDHATTATAKTRAGCEMAYPYIIAASEALAAAWEHITSIGDTQAADRRTKRQLADEHAKLFRKLKRDRTAFQHACTRRPDWSPRG